MPGKSRPLPSIPDGLRSLFRAAARDVRLLERIIAGRSGAARKAGFVLDSNEQATLDVVSETQLRVMVSMAITPAPPSVTPIQKSQSSVRRPASLGIDPEMPPRRSERKR
ncbi:MAG: hypothetical protein HY901_17750 [Deltaproteobacteria bacterium]|nr:hypothetical protein [Deltaproteobacteria bacterium]